MNIPSIYENALLNNIVTTEDGEYLSILEWIEQNISTKKRFTVDIVYMKKILGPEFRTKFDDTIYTALRRILGKYNIALRIKNKYGVTTLIMTPFA